jgi:hypothetical protein
MAQMARHVEWENLLPSPYGGASLAKPKEGGKYLIEGWSNV